MSIQLTRLRGTVAISAALFLLTVAAGSPESDLAALQARLTSARAAVVNDFVRINTQTGDAAQIVARLDEDQASLALAAPGDPASSDDLRLRVELDLSLVAQLTGQLAGGSAAPSGPQMRLVKSSSDQTLQPLAIYVPAGNSPSRAAPLVLMLHGQRQTESGLLSDAALRRLADASGAVFAVPYARGDHPVDNATQSDIDDALRLVLSNFKIDSRRVYLAGFSYGAFATFMLAPHDASRWAGVLSVAGSITNDDKDSFVRAMQGKPVFLVIGSDDPLVRAEYVQDASAYLAANGVESHLYVAKGGVHSIDSLVPTLERAWNDMLAGVHFITPEPETPLPLPTPSQRY